MGPLSGVETTTGPLGQGVRGRLTYLEDGLLSIAFLVPKLNLGTCLLQKLRFHILLSHAQPLSRHCERTSALHHLHHGGVAADLHDPRGAAMWLSSRSSTVARIKN